MRITEQDDRRVGLSVAELAGSDAPRPIHGLAGPTRPWPGGRSARERRLQTPRDGSSVLLAPVRETIAIVVLGRIRDPVSVAVAPGGKAAEELLPEVREQVPIGILRGVDDAVMVAVGANRIGHARAPLPAVSQAVPVAVSGGRDPGCDHDGREREQRPPVPSGHGLATTPSSAAPIRSASAAAKVAVRW